MAWDMAGVEPLSFSHVITSVGAVIGVAGRINSRTPLASTQAAGGNHAEVEAQDALFNLPLTTDFQIHIAEKLIKREERFDRVVLDKKITSREHFYKTLPN